MTHGPTWSSLASSPAVQRPVLAGGVLTSPRPSTPASSSSSLFPKSLWSSSSASLSQRQANAKTGAGNKPAESAVPTFQSLYAAWTRELVLWRLAAAVVWAVATPLLLAGVLYATTGVSVVPSLMFTVPLAAALSAVTAAAYHGAIRLAAVPLTLRALLFAAAAVSATVVLSGSLDAEPVLAPCQHDPAALCIGDVRVFLVLLALVNAAAVLPVFSRSGLLQLCPPAVHQSRGMRVAAHAARLLPRAVPRALTLLAVCIAAYAVSSNWLYLEITALLTWLLGTPVLARTGAVWSVLSAPLLFRLALSACALHLLWSWIFAVLHAVLLEPLPMAVAGLEPVELLLACVEDKKAPLMQLLGMRDLLTAAQFDPTVRRAIYLRRDGAIWHDLAKLCVTELDALTKAISAAGKPGGGSSKKSASHRLYFENRQLRDHRRQPHWRDDVRETLARAAFLTLPHPWAQRIAASIQPAAGAARRGSKVSSSPSWQSQVRAAVFGAATGSGAARLAYQRAAQGMLAAQVLAELTSRALQEDEAGVVHRMLPDLLASMLALLSAVSMRVSSAGTDAANAHSLTVVLTQCVYQITTCYYEHLLAFQFPAQVADRLQPFLDFAQ